MTDFPVTSWGLLLLAASLAAIVSRRLKLPYSVGLVLAGIAMAFLPEGYTLPLTRELIFDVLLPPLVFEAALQLKWQDFRRDLGMVLILAFPGLALAAALVAWGMHALLGWSWLGAAFFGVLIAATDPVSVIAAFKEWKVERRLSLLVEAESLLNDGAAAVGFAVLLTVASGGVATPLGIAGDLVWTVAGGVVAGGAVAGLVLLLAKPSKDHAVEITLTMIGAYGSFLLAERLGVSGVLASLTAGLIIGNVGLPGREPVVAFWEYAAFLANAVVFILIGQQEARQAPHLLSVTVPLGILLVLAGRVVAIYPLCAGLSKLLPPIGWRYRHVLVWGGLRGALGLALALALPETVPERDAIVVMAFAVVAFSIFVQGLTMPWLLRRLGFL